MIPIDERRSKEFVVYDDDTGEIVMAAKCPVFEVAEMLESVRNAPCTARAGGGKRKLGAVRMDGGMRPEDFKDNRVDKDGEGKPVVSRRPESPPGQA